MKKGDIKTGSNGIKYELIKRIGKGGQAEVWKAQNKNTNMYYAYKEYKHNINNIKANIEDLITIGKFHDKDGKPVDDVILPITVVECNGDSFGYIMELVDLQDFTVIKKPGVVSIHHARQFVKLSRILPGYLKHYIIHMVCVIKMLMRVMFFLIPKMEIYV